METNKEKTTKWFFKNYIGWLLILLLGPIVGSWGISVSENTSELLLGISTILISLGFCKWTFGKIREHYYTTVIKFKSVE